jgi:hypothetical protein
MFHKIRSVSPRPGFQLLVHFSEGCAKVYDLARLFPDYPAFSTLQTIPGLYEQVRVDPGGYGISWSDALDLDGEELWANGQLVDTPFDDLLSFHDAASLWGLHESTLRKAVAYGKLLDGIDVQKFGKQWIVTRSAMERAYGPQPA